jgi:HK97 family phage portal protein
LAYTPKAVRLFTRAIRPPDDITPNPNDPVSVPPSTVGPDQLVTPGDPHGVTVTGTTGSASPPPRIIPSAWSGWPGEWWPPLWGSSGPANLTDLAWLCVDMNSSLLATMPPYLVNAAPTLNSDWLRNPDPDIYTSWDEFAKQLFWDYQAAGEVFVIATSYYATGWPARFHVVPPWFVEVELAAGVRRYSIGRVDVTPDVLHIRYQSTVSDARGHGPLEAGQYRLVAAQMLVQYGAKLAGGLIPPGILTHQEEISPEQATALQQQWVNARLSTIGEPAVLWGGIKYEPTQINPRDMSLVDLTRDQESRIACLLGVPPALVGLPSGGDPMTYSNVTMYFTQHWRVGLRPKAQAVMDALSGWLLPRQTRVELNRDAYIEPEPLVRAQTAQILAGIVDPVTGAQALTVDEIRAAERLDNSTPADISAGVLK